jgi:hypothetical protein
VQSSAVWNADNVADSDQWSVRLSDPERTAIVEAARRAVDNGRTVATVDRQDFDLPMLGPGWPGGSRR